jgi:two-component system sensor histidine kinase TctE
VKVGEYRLRKLLLRRLAVPLSALLVTGAALSIALAIHVGNLVHDRWLLDSAMTLATQLTLNKGEPSLQLSPEAIRMFEWDSLDRIYEEATASDGRRLFGRGQLPTPPANLVDGQPVYYDAEIAGVPVRVVAVSVASPNDLSKPVTIQVAETLKKRKALVREVILLLAPVLAGILVIAAAMVWIAVTTSLAGLETVALRLRDYDPDHQHPLPETPGAPSEIKSLVLAINGMIAKVVESRAAQQRFVANAAHQLRTPLTALQVQTERTLREANPELHAEALADVLKSVTRMRHLTQQLLVLTRSDAASEAVLTMGNLDLAELARRELERWADAAIERGIDLGYEGPERGVWVRGEAHLLGELIGNLVDNAIRYGKTGGAVTLGVRASPIAMYVEDDGPGIAPEERERVLSPFYRTPMTGGDGCGLGLTIAREIAARHGAQLVIAESATKGARIELLFEAGAERLGTASGEASEVTA